MKEWNEVTLTGPSVCIDCRSRWQRFKDFFRPKNKLTFHSKETITHRESELIIPDSKYSDE